jgi:hypothetical protein
MDNKRIVIYGGGTFWHVANHFSLCAPAFGGTARRLARMAKDILPKMDVDLRLTRMADHQSRIETNNDIAADLTNVINDDITRIVVMSAAMCDFEGYMMPWEDAHHPGEKRKLPAGVFADRLRTDNGQQFMQLIPAEKIIRTIRQKRKDIFLVGFKTTCGEDPDVIYIRGLDLCKKASCNLVLANDTKTKFNMVVTPEESRYHETYDRNEVLRGLLEMVFHRTHLNFTRSTVVDGQPVPWDSPDVPETLRRVVNYCIEQNAYKPFNGVTAGHFACKLNDTTFLTSIRKTNFNELAKNGLVKIVTDGPDAVIAYGAKPSVGGQSQRIVFHDHPGLDSIVHFHCPKKPDSKVPTVSQREFECGSHECGHNTSRGLAEFGNIKAVYLDQHGPNIVFNSKAVTAEEVIAFINENFDLDQKTGGFVSIKSRLETPNTLETAQRVL